MCPPPPPRCCAHTGSVSRIRLNVAMDNQRRIPHYSADLTPPHLPFFLTLAGVLTFFFAVGFEGLAGLFGFLATTAVAGLLTLAAAAGFAGNGCSEGTGFAGAAVFAAGADFSLAGGN